MRREQRSKISKKKAKYKDSFTRMLKKRQKRKKGQREQRDEP